MDMKLLQDTIDLLRSHIDSGTDIDWMEMDNRPVRDIADMLNAYELAYSRKMTVLACCILIHTALNKHGKLQAKDNERLTRLLLDGDYLTGLMYRIAVKRKEWKLLSRLLPFHKRMQLSLLKNVSPERIFNELKREIRSYLEQRSA
ncbi:hypothetical protein SAMN04488688_104285 [Paenibacillus sp. cl141a]|uniref:hypothetical protein n=1 Tax=Bacillales TaxID=1385 RepID=UPI0001788B35|nr:MULTISPECIES: hypothetical protein [Paenibacillus]MBY0164539.1 hypothetical protein [Cytobacillus firmus]ACX62707.1 hypothetical protein GYMC10_0401 [Paenibacillus sp. Y412MC10]EGG34357.1 conserved domain protein [Paenibacillus sp. HGF5]ETT59997.1 hypothetical protein C172_24223 [Paenibacillus sp. FSL H8-457]MCM3260998.1 hypothetical protein [Paenibacillus lautus]